MKKAVVFLIIIFALIALGVFLSRPKTTKQIIPNLESKTIKASPTPDPSPTPPVINEETNLEELNTSLTPDDFSSDYTKLKDSL